MIESIADDTVNEPEEMFSISLNKVSSFVTLSATTGNVVIVDDDGKMLKKQCSLIRISSKKFHP